MLMVIIMCAAGLTLVFIGFCALNHRRKVIQRFNRMNLPIIPKAPAGIEPEDDAMCISLRDRTIFTARGVTVVAERKHRDS